MCEKRAIDGETHPRCRTRYSLDGLVSFFHYDSIIRKAVKALKYRLVSDLATEFVCLIPQSSLFQVARLVRSQQTVLIPIPLHRTRFMERGFNQAEVLGRLMAQKLHIPMRTDILMRTHKTIPQVAMKTREERLTNMGGVFSIKSETTSIPTSAIVFDDVFTTGATMRAAVNVLKRGGIKHVWAVTIAR